MFKGHFGLRSCNPAAGRTFRAKTVDCGQSQVPAPEADQKAG
jgi:hypothetical protein